jgi:two-component system sensor histidine kinase BaeS
VLADETRLAQVFGNLLQNTLRYTDAPGKLAVAVRREGERVVLEWQDSSPGVPEADLPRLTERLFRVDASRSRAGGGSGLGLAIVKAIVEAHGGTFVARASRLGGLALEVALPAARGAHG